MQPLLPSTQSELNAEISITRKRIQNAQRVAFYAKGKLRLSAKENLTELEDRLEVLYSMQDLEL